MQFFKKNSVKNVCLLGLMGSGKSVIGKELSKFYNMDFLDTDQIIEEKTGKKITFIFKNYGETYFRAIEEKICLQILKKENCVIALGGGSIVSSKVRELMNKNSFSIYLKVDIEILLDRIRNSSKRPIAYKSSDKKLIELINKRSSIYSKALYEIKCDNLSKTEIVKKIIEIYETH